MGVTQQRASSFAHKVEGASTNVPAGSIADLLAKLELAAGPERPIADLLSGLPYNVIIKMNRREIKEAFDEFC